MHVLLFVIPLQMSFLHLWDMGRHPWQQEGERAREELKVQLDMLPYIIQSILAWHLLRASCRTERGNLCFVLYSVLIV